MAKQSSRQKTRGEIDQFVGAYMENVDVKNGKALPFKTTSNGNCFFHSILYHVGRGNLKATHHDLKELREGAFDAIKKMNLPQNIEINGLTKGKFDKKYKKIQKSEGVSHYHYADVLSVSSMANQYEKHIIILDDSGFVQIVPTESKAVSDTLTNEAEGNYYVIRRENGNHYRPYIYREKSAPQLFTDVVLDILNRKINDTDKVVLNDIKSGTGVSQYSITWEDITSLLDVPSEYIHKSSITLKKNSSSTYMNKTSNNNNKINTKENKKRVNDLIEWYTNDKKKLPFNGGNHELTFDELLQQDDVWLEKAHDYIQWLFPTQGASDYNKEAPLVKQADINKLPKEKMFQALNRFRSFLEGTKEWKNKKDHNQKRITRILDSLIFRGLEDEALNFYDFVKTESNNQNNRFWSDVISQIKPETKTLANSVTKGTTRNNRSRRRRRTRNAENNRTRNNERGNAKSKLSNPNMRIGWDNKPRKIGGLRDVEYCFIGCDDHILVLLYDVLIAFVERLGLD